MKCSWLVSSRPRDKILKVSEKSLGRDKTPRQTSHKLFTSVIIIIKYNIENSFKFIHLQLYLVKTYSSILCSFLVTGVMLRSHVFVDNINSIEILTTTRELLLGEPPEVYHIQAFDTEGKTDTEKMAVHVHGVGVVV